MVQEEEDTRAMKPDNSKTASGPFVRSRSLTQNRCTQMYRTIMHVTLTWNGTPTECFKTLEASPTEDRPRSTTIIRCKTYQPIGANSR